MSGSRSPRGMPPSLSPRSPHGDALPEEPLVLPVSKNDSRAASVARKAGSALLMAGQFKQAVAQYEKACSSEPSNARNFEMCANAMIKAGSPGEARGKLIKAKELDPYSAGVFVVLARLAMAKSKVEQVSSSTDINLLRELLVLYNQAYELDPGNSFQSAERRKELLKLVKTIPDFAGGVSHTAAELRRASYAFSAKKHLEKAIRSISEAIEAEPENPRNYVRKKCPF